MPIPRILSRVAGWTVAGLAATAVVIAGTAGAATAKPTTTVLSRNPAGVDGNGHSTIPAVSRNGLFITFRSNATNLIPRKPDEPPARDVYLWDATANRLEVVSVDSAGHRLPGHSGYDVSPVTDNGRFVAFSSLVAKPVPADPKHVDFDVFLRTRFGNGGGTTQDVSVGIGGAAANGQNIANAISDDSRFIALTSTSTNLVAGDTNGVADVFLRDNGYRMNVRISVGAGGVQANGASGQAAISASGRYTVYSSRATNLVPGDTNNASDVFLFDRSTRTTSLVSVDGAGRQLPGGSSSPSISRDGRYVAFESQGTDFRSRIYVRDLVAGTTTLVSVSTTGVPANGTSSHASISASGRYVSFQSFGNLVPGVQSAQVFVRDLVANKTFVGSVSPGGTPANGPTFFGQIGDAGLVFQSLARNLGGHPNGEYQVYYHSL